MVTPIFKSGDLIRCIHPGDQPGLTHGKTYKVLPGGMDMVRITDDNGEPAHYFTTRFELARNRPTTIRSAWNITEADKP